MLLASALLRPVLLWCWHVLALTCYLPQHALRALAALLWFARAKSPNNAVGCTAEEAAAYDGDLPEMLELCERDLSAASAMLPFEEWMLSSSEPLLDVDPQDLANAVHAALL